MNKEGGIRSARRHEALEEALAAETRGQLSLAREGFLRLLRNAREEGERTTLRYLIARTCVASGSAALVSGRRRLKEALEALQGGTRADFPLEGRWYPLVEPLVLSLDSFLLYQLRRERESHRQLKRLLASVPKGEEGFSERYARAQARHNLALCAVKLQRPEEALLSFRQAMKSYASLGLEHAVSRVADGLGQLLSVLGQFREARTFLEISLRIKRRNGDLRGQAISLGALSRAAARSGDLATALRCSERVLSLSQKAVDLRGQVAGLIYRADSIRLSAQKDLETASVVRSGTAALTRRAARLLLKARADYLAASARSPDPVFRLNAASGLAMVQFLLGEQAEARRELALARRLYGGQQGIYPEIEEGLRELARLLEAGASEAAPFLRLSDHVREAVEGQRKSVELKSAKDFQEKLLPAAGESVAGVRIDFVFEPFSETSGDFYDFFETEDGGFAVVGDVTGHGAGAAMLMVPAVMALREGRQKPIEERVRYANQVLAEHAPAGQFATLCAVSWKREAREVLLLNAGHPHPYALGWGGRARSLEPPSQPALGLFPEAAFTATTAPLEAGDRILLLSDGVTEMRDAGGSFYERKLPEDLRRLARLREPRKLLDGISSSALRFAEGRGPEDDRTLLLLTFGG